MPSRAKRYRRYGAFLQLYGPKGAPTHAKLVISNSHQFEEDTPEHFLVELAEERRRDAMLNPIQRMQPMYRRK
jgi:hypothetical protein